MAAVANAKLGAIEQAVGVEDLAMTSPLNIKHEDSNERTRTWLGDQQQVITDKMNEELKQLQEQATPDRKEFLIGDTTTHHRSSAFHGGATGPHDQYRRHEPADVQHCFNAIVATNERLMESPARQSLPKCRPDLFTGDVTMFHPWKSAFKAMVRDVDISPDQEINYLYKYTSGEPRRLIDNF